MSTDSQAGDWLRKALGLPETQTPFPWQQELLARFAKGELERSLDIPTGLGKTSVIAIWIVARALGAKLPRRLVYVVDRRAVVDQATEVANGLRDFVDGLPELKSKLGLGERSLPISTLRGQFVDNKEWLYDPSMPAIIVGTVDMVGSRLLFQGYGTTRKMRPYQAGLLGADTLVVLDEAHLVPSFEKLLDAVANDSAVFGPKGQALRALVPTFRLMSLSATGRATTAKSFGLLNADLEHPVVKRRLVAPKLVTVLPTWDEKLKLKDILASQAWKLTDNGTLPVRCIVFSNKRSDAQDALSAVKKFAEGDKKSGVPSVKIETELFVGGRRVREREEAAMRLKALGFIAGNSVERTCSSFVFATSAGEVGVDLDADHMVSDLVAWERMVQRLGRVNRRGDGRATVIVVAETPSKDAAKAQNKAPEDRNSRERGLVEDSDRTEAARQLLDCLPREHGAIDGSPGALAALKTQAGSDARLQNLIDRATTPAPLRPALTRAVVDAWSMTSLTEHTGRPDVSPWIRGWVEDDPPQTAVIWRKYLPTRRQGTELRAPEMKAFFEAAPGHASEILETDSFRVVEWLTERASAIVSRKEQGTPQTPSSGKHIDEGLTNAPIEKHEVVAFALTQAAELSRHFRLGDLALPDDAQARKEHQTDLRKSFAGATLVVDARIGGLSEGLLDSVSAKAPCTADDGADWIVARGSRDETTSSRPTAPVIPFRVRIADGADSATSGAQQWYERLRLAFELSADGETTRWLIIDKWRDDAATEEDRSAGPAQLLDEHQSWTEERAHNLGRHLDLPQAYVEMLATAARLHDEGKRAQRWQRAFSAKSDGTYAKTRGPLRTALLDGYRHEFGSLPRAAADGRFLNLSSDLQDLALHLIVAHHGFARPVISTKGCEEPPSVAEAQAREVALRFARLQLQWGPWALAWWEALLRAADQQASRANDERALDQTAGDR